MKRPFFMLPVLGIAAALAFGFFKIYGLFTRPDVPLQVSATISHFAPGVAIGKTMSESRKKVYDARWVQHLGYVGEINSYEFALIRLAAAGKARHKPFADDRALVESVEFVSVNGGAEAKTMLDVGTVFRSSPKDGCIIPSRDDMPYRRVQYWTTKADRGGVALISDWTFTSETSTAGIAVWSMVAWAGPFKGSESLLAHFDSRPCRDIVGT